MKENAFCETLGIFLPDEKWVEVKALLREVKISILFLYVLTFFFCSYANNYYKGKCSPKVYKLTKLMFLKLKLMVKF